MSPKDIMLNYFFHEPNYNCKCDTEYLDFSEVQDHSNENLSICNNKADTLRQNEALAGQQQDRRKPSQSAKGSDLPVLMPFFPISKNKNKRIYSKVISLDESNFYNEETDFE